MTRTRTGAIRKALLPGLVALGLTALLGGCVAYPAYPGYGYYGPGYAYAPVVVGGGWGWHGGGGGGGGGWGGGWHH